MRYSPLRRIAAREYIALVILNLIFGKTMARAKIIVIAAVCVFLLGCLAQQPEQSLDHFERPETGAYGLVTATAGAASVWVYAYHNQAGGLRGPADFAARVDGDGRYLLDLPPGQWFLVARARQQGPMAGPPHADDTWAIYEKNPLVLRSQEVRQVDLQLLQMATTSLRNRPLSRSNSGFSGRLIGPNQKPVAGAVVLAYRNQDYRRSPEYVSTAVAEDGLFTLYVAPPGRYCLVARQGTRGQPRQGELYGLLGVGDAGCRELTKGEILDVGEIHLTPHLR